MTEREPDRQLSFNLEEPRMSVIDAEGEKQLMFPIEFRLRPGQEISLGVDEHGIARIDIVKDLPKEKEFPIFEHLNTGMMIDTETLKVSKPDGSQKQLTKHEMVLLSLLLAKPNRVVSKEEYLAALYPGQTVNSMSESKFRDSMKVYIKRIRKKIETDRKHPFISNIRGSGYLINGEVRRHSK